MKVIFIIFVWLLMGAILATGVVMAVHGTLWVMIVGLLLFIAALTKYGILSH